MSFAEFILWFTMKAEDAGFSETPQFGNADGIASASIGKLRAEAHTDGLSITTPGFSGKIPYANIP